MKKAIAMILMSCLMLTALCAGAFADGGYQVKTVDPDGNPVQGVMVQFCSDDQCLMGRTGADGIASFDMPAGSYTVHLLKVPVGYEKDSTEYPIPATPELVELTVRPEGYVAPESADADDDVIDAPKIGLHYETPEALRGMKGQFIWDYNFMDEGVLDIPVQYLAVSEADTDAYMALYRQAVEEYTKSGKEPEPDPDHPSWLSGYESTPIYDLYIINGGRGEKELREVIESNYGFGEDILTMRAIGSDGDHSFFLSQYSGLLSSLDEYKPIIGDFYDEFESLVNDPSVFLSGVKLSAPEWPKTKKAGEVFSFRTTDLDGNAVDSAELFAKAKVTVVNCWATWCGPCKRELPELGELAKTFEDKGCQLVGLCTDATDDEVAATAKSLLSDAGAAYLNLRCTDAINEDISLLAWPTTYFVDSEGKLLTAPFEGADPATYSAMLDECLTRLG